VSVAYDTGGGVGSAVGTGVGATLGEAVMLGVALGTVGLADGDAVGLADGDAVGLADGDAVGLADGLAVAIATSGVDVAPAPVELGCVEPVRLTATKYTTTKTMDTPARNRRSACTRAILPRSQ
jgi:hypothetical protein